MENPKLLKHSNSNVHLSSAKSEKKQVTLFELSKLKELENTEKKVKEGELKIAAFVAEHDLLFNLLEHLPKLLTFICPDSSIEK